MAARPSVFYKFDTRRGEYRLMHSYEINWSPKKIKQQMQLILRQSRTARSWAHKIRNLPKETLLELLSQYGLNKTGSNEVLCDRLLRYSLRYANPELNVPWVGARDAIKNITPSVDHLHEFVNCIPVRRHSTVRKVFCIITVLVVLGAVIFMAWQLSC